jgi:hypothetical protein
LYASEGIAAGVEECRRRADQLAFCVPAIGTGIKTADRPASPSPPGPTYAPDLLLPEL